MYYLTADGGGTKLIVVVYDDKLNLVSFGSASGTNANFKSLDEINKSMSAAVREAVRSGIKEIENADFVIVGPKDAFVKAISSEVKLGGHTVLNEGQAALMAGIGEKYGILAQAGTGSDIFYLGRDKNDSIGGWGTVLGDEGSGYDIGVATLRAAVYSEDGRGEKSILPELIKEEWKLKKLWDMIQPVYHSPDQRRLVASVTKITSRAAKLGDEVAISVYKRAAYEMAKMTTTLFTRHGGNCGGKIVVSGGAWKGSRVMFEEYSSLVRREYPDTEISLPVFEPIIGGIVNRMIERGLNVAEHWDRLKVTFADYLYKTNW